MYKGNNTAVGSRIYFLGCKSESMVVRWDCKVLGCVYIFAGNKEVTLSSCKPRTRKGEWMYRSTHS